MTTTAAIISIGDELLSGKIEDQNTSFLLNHLNQQGINISCTLMLPDEVHIISRFLKPLPQMVDLIFVTGGLGPTHDDITLQAISTTFEAPLETSSVLEMKIRQMYGNRCTQDHLKMADIPKGTELITLPDHKIPVIKFQKIFVFPGVPELMQYLFLQIKDQFVGIRMAERELFLDADEGIIANELRTAIDQFEGLKIGSYPTASNIGGYRIRLLMRHQDGKILNKAVNQLKTTLGKYLVKS